MAASDLFLFCTHCIVLTTKNLVSIPHHTVDPLYPFHFPHLNPSHLAIAILFSVSTCLFLFSLFTFICFFYFIYEWNHTVFFFIWLVSLTLKVYPCCHKWRGFMLFYDWVIFHVWWYIHISHFIHFSLLVDGLLGCFWFGVIINNTAATIPVRVLWCAHVCISTGYRCKSRIPRS